MDYLVEVIEKSEFEAYYLFDERCKTSYNTVPPNRKEYLTPSIYKRHSFYKKNKNKFDKVFCFGNLPPTIRLRSIVYTYYHNVLTLDFPKSHPFKAKVKNTFKQLLLRVISKNTNFYLVQTKSVQNLLERKLNLDKKKIVIHPFFEIVNSDVQEKRLENQFIYVSDGASHKNHIFLLDVFEKFSTISINKPILVLTVSQNFVDLNIKINELIQKGLHIKNIGVVPRAELVSFYKASKYSIYASKRESFGLGLIESAYYGCSVIAPDLNYVHDVIVPSLTYDIFKPEELLNVLLHLDEKSLKETEIIVKNELDQILKLLF